jgi:hypothetical protein
MWRQMRARVVVGIAAAALATAACVVVLMRRGAPETLVRAAGERMPTRAPGEPPLFVVSLLVREDAVWFAHWVLVTQAALANVQHWVVASASPEVYDSYAAYNFKGVLFSPPIAKHAWGLDLLRGHVNNLRTAALHVPDYTHAVLAASNNMWLRQMDPAWPGFALSTHGDCGCECHSPAVRGSTSWHWGKLGHDQRFWEFINAKRVDVCRNQVEGYMATRQAWTIAMDYIDDLLNHNIEAESGVLYRDVAYPAEEIYLGTAFCANNLTKLTLSKNFWDALPTLVEIEETRAQGFALIKRVPRKVGDPILYACTAGWYV